MIHEVKRLNLNYPTSRAVWEVDGQTIASLQGVGGSSAAWGTATVALYRANSEHGPWHALETAQTLGPGDFISAAFEVSFSHLSAEIVADETADEWADFYLWTDRR